MNFILVMIKNPMKKWLLIFILSPLIIGFALSLASSTVLTLYAQSQLQQLESETLKISFSRIEMRGFKSPKLHLHDLKILFGNTEYTHWNFKVESIIVQPIWWDWIDKKFSISEVEINQANVTLAEKKVKKEVSKKSHFNDLPTFDIQSIALQNSQFTYLNKDPGNERPPGKLKFKKINGEIDSIDNDKINNEFLTGSLYGFLGKGKLSVDLKTRILKKPFKVLMKSKIENIDLSKVNDYLKPTEGLALSGKLNLATTHSELFLKNITTKAQLFYEDLNLEVINTNERSSFSSGIAEAFIQGKLCNTNKDRGGFEKVHSLVRKKKQENSIVQSLLLGLLDTALKAACFN